MNTSSSPEASEELRAARAKIRFAFPPLPDKATIDQVVAASELHLQHSTQMREDPAHFLAMRETVAKAPKPLAAEMSDLLRQVADAINLEAVNAFEMSALYRAEAAILLGEWKDAVRFRRDLYARLLALCVLESCRTLRGLLGWSSKSSDRPTPQPPLEYAARR